MDLLEKLGAEDPQKLEEFAVFHWFTKADGIEYSDLRLSERPDFIMTLDDRTIGVEITMAQRPMPDASFSAKQIEAAQWKFAEEILARVRPKLPLEIGLIFNDEVPVDKATVGVALDVIVPLIDRVSESMSSHSIERLVRNKEDLRATGGRLHICPEVPEFLQHIQLFNDGHKFTCIGGSRGGVMSDFSDVELLPMLERKHHALQGYQKCDEQWLVIYAGIVPAIILPDEPPKIMIPTMASTFGTLTATVPVESSFDRICYFRSPTDVVQLTA